MSLLPTKYYSRGLAILLASCLLLGSFLAVTGLCIKPGPERAEISLDVCHPLQAAHPVTNIVVARPAAGLSMPMLFAQGSIVDRPVAKLSDCLFTPDPPPPKALA
jgi:hypothetical protein